MQLFACVDHARIPTTGSAPDETIDEDNVLLFYPFIRSQERVFMRLRRVDSATGAMTQFWALVADGDGNHADNFRLPG